MQTEIETIPVPFHGNTLYLIDHNGEPYAPMKPIVEGMGLDWGGQHKKLTSDSFRWGCVSLKGIQVPGDTQGRETLCMLLRKLPGWLMTVQPTRVRPEIREKILRYQNECDDVLWEYWTKGIAVNPRGARGGSEFDILVRGIDALTRRIARLENLVDSPDPSERTPAEPVRVRYTPEQREGILMFRKLQNGNGSVPRRLRKKYDFIRSECALLTDVLHRTYVRELQKRGRPEPEDRADFVAWLISEHPEMLAEVGLRYDAFSERIDR
jgi:hypothetical protein